jgi:hypothetical protein
MGRINAPFERTAMHIRRPSRPRQGKTMPAQDEIQQPVPRQPHERDETADQQGKGGEASAPRMAEQGRRDLERGLVDTDKGPALHEAYDKVREGTPDPEKKLRR